VILEPAEYWDDLVRGKLVHATFAEKPKYEALSYTWGNEAPKEIISLDGKYFTVGLNLLHALRKLRDPENERILWIDAICIDQSNVPERTAQLRIMPYIYQRAQAVLVSLAKPPRSSLKKRRKSGAVVRMDIPKYKLKNLCSNEYWKRLWIIQEISLARKLLLYYGKSKFDWSVFVGALESDSEFQNSVPMRLQKQLEGKYTDGHKLQTLLQSHQDALCKEPRDKIYGFVGLATDCIEGYPLDYQRSLFEVWKDAMIFKNADRHGQQHDIMKFGKLVQTLLGGKRIATVDEVIEDIKGLNLAPPGIFIPTLEEPSQLLIPGRFVGYIAHFGPTVEQIIADLKQTSSWRSAINRHIPDHQRARVREESALFLEMIEELEPKDLDIVSSYYRELSWQVTQVPACIQHLEAQQADISLDEMSKSPNAGLSPQIPFEDPRLFLLGGSSNLSDSCGKMGLAPAEARTGDYICLIHGIKRAVVLRKHNERLIIVGTAAMAANRWKAKRVIEEDDKSTSSFEAAEFESISSDDRVDLFMDVAMAYQLLD
jgi:hypothetical protein